MKIMNYILGVTLVALLWSCEDNTTSNNVKQPEDMVNAKSVNIDLKALYPEATSKAIGDKYNDGDPFQIDKSNIVLLLLNDDGSLILDEDGNPDQNTQIELNQFMGVTPSFSENTFTYSAEIELPDYASRVGIFVNFAQPNVNKMQSSSNKIMLPAKGYGSIVKNTEGTEGDPYTLTVTLEPMVARIQIENDLVNSTEATFPAPLNLVKATGLANGEAITYYESLYENLRIEAIYLNRTYVELNSLYFIPEVPMAGIAAPEIDITGAGYAWEETYTKTDMFTPDHLVGSKYALFNSHNPYLFYYDTQDNKVMANINAALNTVSHEDRWRITGDRVGQAPVLDAPTKTIADSWPTMINPALQSCFFQTDETAAESNAGALGYNIYAQGEATATRDEALLQQPHLVVEFSYSAIAQLNPDGSFVKDAEGFMVYDDVAYGTETKYLNIVAFEETINPQDPAKPFPAFEGGFVYTLQLSEIVNLILDPETVVTEEGNEDPEGQPEGGGGQYDAPQHRIQITKKYNK